MLKYNVTHKSILINQLPVINLPITREEIMNIKFHITLKSLAFNNANLRAFYK